MVRKSKNDIRKIRGGSLEWVDKMIDKMNIKLDKEGKMSFDDSLKLIYSPARKTTNR